MIAFFLNQAVSPDTTYVGITQSKNEIWKSEALLHGNVQLAHSVVKDSNALPERQGSQELQDFSSKGRLVSKIESVITAYDTHKPKPTSLKPKPTSPDSQTRRPSSRQVRPQKLVTPRKPTFLVSASHFCTLLNTLPSDDRNVAERLQRFTKDGKTYFSLPDRAEREYVHKFEKWVQPYLKEESDVTIVFDKKDFVQIEELARVTDKFGKNKTYSYKLHTKMFDQKVINEDPGTPEAALALTGKEDGLEPNDQSLSHGGGASKSSGRG